MGSVSSVSIYRASRVRGLATPYSYGLLVCLRVRSLCRLVVAPLLLYHVCIAVALAFMAGREAMCIMRWCDARPPLSEKIGRASCRERV